MANSVNAKVSVPNKNPANRIQRQLTFEIISEWIRLQGFDEYTTEGLIKLAASYPTQALPNFRKNFNIMIERVRQDRRKQQQQQGAAE